MNIKNGKIMVHLGWGQFSMGKKELLQNLSKQSFCFVLFYWDFLFRRKGSDSSFNSFLPFALQETFQLTLLKKIINANINKINARQI